MSDEQSQNASGQYTVDMLTTARNKCFEHADDPALPMDVRNEFSVRYSQLDQLIDELMTKQFHEKTRSQDEVDDVIRTNQAIAAEMATLETVAASADTSHPSLAIVDKILKIGMPLVEV